MQMAKTDQSGQFGRLIRIFIGCTCHIVGLPCSVSYNHDNDLSFSIEDDISC